MGGLERCGWGCQRGVSAMKAMAFLPGAEAR